MKMYVFDDRRMLEHDIKSVVARVKSVLSQRSYAAGLRNKKFAWLDAEPKTVIAGLVDFLAGLS